MVGRKRKQNVKREPNGRGRREKTIEPNAIAQLMPHRRLVPANVAHDQRAECIMGRLCLNGWITEIQYQAGVKYRTATARYRSVLEAPKSTETSMAGVIVGPWGGCSVDERDHADIRDKYMKAFEALVEAVGNRGARDVAHCMHDKHPFEIPRVKCGLTALAIHYGLTNRNKSGLSH